MAINTIHSNTTLAKNLRNDVAFAKLGKCMFNRSCTVSIFFCIGVTKTQDFIMASIQCLEQNTYFISHITHFGELKQFCHSNWVLTVDGITCISPSTLLMFQSKGGLGWDTVVLILF